MTCLDDLSVDVCLRVIHFARARMLCDEGWAKDRATLLADIELTWRREIAESSSLVDAVLAEFEWFGEPASWLDWTLTNTEPPAPDELLFPQS